MHRHLPIRMFSAKPRSDVALVTGYSFRTSTTTVHAAGCRDLAKADQVGATFSLSEALKYADDYYEVAPCAKERNWNAAERALRPDW